MKPGPSAWKWVVSHSQELDGHKVRTETRYRPHDRPALFSHVDLLSPVSFPCGLSDGDKVCRSKEKWKVRHDQAGDRAEGRTYSASAIKSAAVVSATDL